MPNGKPKKKKRGKGGVAAAVIVGLLIGGGILLWTRRAEAAPGVQPPPSGGGPSPPPPGRTGRKPSTLLKAAPTPVSSGIPDVGKPLSSSDTTAANDPLKAGGWKWAYLGVVDPVEANTVIGTKVSPSALPFSKAAVTQITPLANILHAYYVGPGDVLVQGYYLIGPLKSSGYGFQAGAWGIVEVWDPAWH